VLVPLLGQGVVTADRSVPSAVLVAVVDEDHRASSDGLAEQLRRNGVPCEVAPAAQKFGKQIRHAERRGIPYVLFPGADGAPAEIKDIRSGDQAPVDVATWTPPVEDLRPRITTVIHAPEEQQQ
jgi:histidyl-tRNA synthetase